MTRATARTTPGRSTTTYLLHDHPELAQIRGTGGVVNRLGIVVLSAVGMVFFLLLLVYIAANLLLASLFFVVLLLLAPVMLLFPAFGEAGRRAFWRWLGYAAGALLAKVIYALYLGVLLFASAVVGGIGMQNGGWLLEWILFAALWDSHSPTAAGCSRCSASAATTNTTTASKPQPRQWAPSP